MYFALTLLTWLAGVDPCELAALLTPLRNTDPPVLSVPETWRPREVTFPIRKNDR